MSTAAPHTEAAHFALQRETANVTTIAVFTLDGEPVSKSRARFTKRGSRTFAYTPEKTKAAEQLVAWKFREAARGHTADASSTYGVFGIFFAGTRQRRDVDNMLKLICDGLNGIAWADDSQVVEVSGRRGFDIAANARTEVWIYRVGEVPEHPKKTCAQCGESFLTYDSWSSKKYCSTKCRSAHLAQARTHPCAHCAAPITGRARIVYCSPECQRASTTRTIVCAVCGSVRTMPKSWASDAASVCAEPECQAAYWRERRKTSAKGTCATCGGPTSKKAYTNCQACNVRLRRKEIA